MSLTRNLFEKDFPPDLNQSLVVDCLFPAYQCNIDCHHPEIGHDGMTFGLNVHKSAKHFLTNLSYKDERIKIASKVPKFLMKIGRYEVGTYKVGNSLHIDPEDSFPKNRVGAYQLTKANHAQGWLPFPDIEKFKNESDAKFTHLILAHVGNEEEGLLRVFIGIPLEINEKRQITKWSDNLFEIWSKDKDGEDFLSITTSNEPKVPIEKVAPPTLKLKSA